jgi:hypothetical protein
MNIYSLLDVEKKLKIGNRGSRKKTSSFGILETRKKEKLKKRNLEIYILI